MSNKEAVKIAKLILKNIDVEKIEIIKEEEDYLLSCYYKTKYFHDKFETLDNLSLSNASENILGDILDYMQEVQNY